MPSSGCSVLHGVNPNSKNKTKQNRMGITSYFIAKNNFVAQVNLKEVSTFNGRLIHNILFQIKQI